MRTLIVAPLAIGLVPKNERSHGTANSVPRALLDISKAPVERQSRSIMRPVAPPAPRLASDHRAREGQGVDAALLELKDLFFASCVDCPPDEELQQRMRTHCRDIEAALRAGELRPWRSGRDCLLARLGFRLLLD